MRSSLSIKHCGLSLGVGSSWNRASEGVIEWLIDGSGIVSGGMDTTGELERSSSAALREDDA